MRYLLIGVLVLAGCAKVEPGYVGIKVNQYGNQKGVEDFPLKTGRVWYNPFTTEVYKFPTFLNMVNWVGEEAITFNSVEGTRVECDVSVSYRIREDKVAHIFVDLRKDIEYVSHQYLRQQVRDAFTIHASKMKVMDIFGVMRQDLLEQIKSDLQIKLEKDGFVFDTIAIVGKLRVDQSVEASINATIEASQLAIKAENKVKQSEAEARQQIAEAEGEAQSILMVAEAQAKANKILAESITPELIQYGMVQKWNGISPQFVGSGGIMPLVTVPVQKAPVQIEK